MEGRRDSKGSFEMVNGLLLLALGTIRITKDVMTLTEQKLLAFLRKALQCTGCGLFRGVKRSVSM